CVEIEQYNSRFGSETYRNGRRKGPGRGGRCRPPLTQIRTCPINPYGSSASSNQTTFYSYDGDNHLVLVDVRLPNAQHEKALYVYGVTTAGGSAVNSNDLLRAVYYPNATTGAPDSTLADSYKYNALGQVTSFTDRNGTVHQFSYDTLGRQTADAVTV